MEVPGAAWGSRHSGLICVYRWVGAWWGAVSAHVNVGAHLEAGVGSCGPGHAGPGGEQWDGTKR